jgi:S-adenosylmethionine hydrolase
MAGKKRALITLTTDFGWRDAYVAAMKGVIYGIDPALRVVDLTHDISPQDIFEGSLFLAGALPYFPKGTVHVAVVDPSVGTGRHPIAVSAGGQMIVCPDNGLPSLFLREHPLQEACIITNPRFMRETVSTTFHGRDVFAPTAAHLARGASLHELGDELDTLVMLDIPRPRKESAECIRGEIMHVDRFGNLVTNIQQAMLRNVTPLTIRAGRHLVRGIHRAYAEVPPGRTLALFGSSGYLEIAINGGNARAALRLDQGNEVIVTLKLAAPPKEG